MATSSRRTVPVARGSTRRQGANVGIEKSLVAKKNSAVKRNGSGDSPYHLRISRLTVDKLGVKLYDKASAVVAELDLPPLSRTK